MMNARWLAAACTMFFASALPAFAAESLDGRTLGIGWSLPFFGLLLTIAAGPLFFHHLWERNYGKIALVWALLAIVPMALLRGGQVTLETVLHAMLIEYIPFIILLFTLYTVAGGILITGRLSGTPLGNTAILAMGTGLASVVGTTGASMILIRPLIRANDGRARNVHVVVFFIFLVSNVGGSLTPLGDPPLFVGFLRGVDFFWTTKALLPATAFSAACLLTLFFVIDTVLRRIDPPQVAVSHPMAAEALRLHGGLNVLLLAAVIAVILATSAWRPGIELTLPGAHVPLQALVRDGLLLLIAVLSLVLTPKPVRTGNDFNWHPIEEVAKLFAAIFICVAPVIAMLQAGKDGVFAPLVALVTGPSGAPLPMAYFWLTGILSAFLDNAPTYLVFFEVAGGDARALMGPLAPVLTAISLGAVFMGALTYIGNAPNMMVAAIARDMKVPMPGFVGYMLWSFGILGPVLGLVALLFVR